MVKAPDGGARALLCMAVALFAILHAGSAAAVPSFARQTGAPCSQCHLGSFGPQLNDYGRQFKLNGYVWGNSDLTLPNLSGMAVGSVTHTAAAQAGGAADGYGENNNFALDQVSLFYAGRVFAKVGALIQGTYDGIAKHFTIDNVDARFADQVTIAKQEVTYGLSVNNNPTVQDLWNSTPAWGFPFAASNLAPTPSAGTLIEGALAQHVGGVTAYTMWNDTLYLEGGAYMTLARGMQSTLGVDTSGENQIDGAAPYWRAALQHAWGKNYVSLGTFGLSASVFPQRDRSAGRDHYLDIGLDANFQTDFGVANTITATTTYIHEAQKLGASSALGYADNRVNNLSTARASISYFYDSTYGFTGGAFSVWGSPDGGIFASEPISGSAIMAPNSKGYTVEATYTPFGKDNSLLGLWANVRLAIQYVAYTKFNGGKLNYDGFGRRAQDNNTIFSYIWLAF